jgi:uncharacterized membrane protein YheB (UPF0754 family)
MNINYIIVPIVGAIIGYTTNWLAIKMLFRPYKAKYLFGIKLPFTPGLIPKEKGRIAVRLGSAVSTDLLNEETLIKELVDDRILDGLDNYIDKLAIKDLVIEDLLNYIDFDKEILYRKITESIVESLKETVNNQELKDRLIKSLLKEEKIKDRIPANGLNNIENIIINNQDKINEFVIENLNTEMVQVRLYEIINKFINNKLKMFKAFIKTESIYNAVNESINDYINSNPNSISSIINTSINNIGEKELKNIVNEDQINKLAEQILTLINNNIGKQVVYDSIYKTIKNLTSRRFNFNETTLEVFKASIQKLYVNFIETQASSLISKLEINTIVENKINSFSTKEMEDLLIGLMKKELNAITSLGAILGFLMGLITLLF